MPYQWTSRETDAGEVRHLMAWPHRSLPRRGFAVFIVITCGMLMIPLYPLIGTVLLWGILPFMVLVVGGVWIALERSYRDAHLTEALTIDKNAVNLTRTNPRGPVQEWDCQSYWTKVEMHPTGGPVPHYVTLKGKGREVEIGAFLSEDERKVLYGELCEVFARFAKALPNPPVG